MNFLISTNDLKNDPKFNDLLGKYSVAKMELISYFCKVTSEDISNTPLKEQILNVKDGD